MTDYILTVSVSIAGGIAAITSAYPALVPHTISLGVLAVALLAVLNLRGVRESGVALSVPTYVFIAMMLLLIGSGFVRLLFGHASAPTPELLRVDALSARQGGSPLAGLALAFLLLRAFAEGCVAMTGTEAISNGVGAFRTPWSRNAAATLTWMAAILATFFLGTSWLAQHYGVMPTTPRPSCRSSDVMFSAAVRCTSCCSTRRLRSSCSPQTHRSLTSRVSSLLARDDYMPRQLAARGDRLAFSNGIVTLAILASVLLIVFRGDTAALIPLYAIGVFVCFTLSQLGMVVRWRKLRTPGWRWRAALNGLGAVATGLVAVVQVVTKFLHGAWIVVLIIPIIIWLLRATHRHYEQYTEELKLDGRSRFIPLHHTVVVPVSGVHKAVSHALLYASAISDDIRAVHVSIDDEQTARLRQAWDEWDTGIELVILRSPYRSVMRPLVNYVERVRKTDPGELVTLVLPEIVPHRWWEHLLHNKTALFIRTAFLFKPNVVVTTVPFHLGRALRVRDIYHRDEELDQLTGSPTAERPAASPAPEPEVVRR